MKIENILIIADKPKHDQTALHRGIEIASAASTHIELVAFAYHSMYGQTDIFDAHQRHAIRHAVEQERTEFLRNLVAEHRLGTMNIEVRTVWTKDISEWVCQHVKETPCGLVIKSVHRSKTLIHTPTDWHLIRQCPKPLLLACQRNFPARARILAALDLGHTNVEKERLNHRVLEAAKAFAQLHGSELHCCFVIEQPTILKALDIIEPSVYKRKVEIRVRERLRALIDAYGLDKRQVHMPVGKVGTALNLVADRIKAEMIIMGVVGRKGLSGITIGNFAEKALAKARCDILALKP